MKTQSKLSVKPQEDSGWAISQSCPSCLNHYVLLHLHRSNDWNDFGLRHCPFCGLCFDQETGEVMV